MYVLHMWALSITLREFLLGMFHLCLCLIYLHSCLLHIWPCVIIHRAQRASYSNSVGCCQVPLDPQMVESKSTVLYIYIIFTSWRMQCTSGPIYDHIYSNSVSVFLSVYLQPRPQTYFVFTTNTAKWSHNFIIMVTVVSFPYFLKCGHSIDRRQHCLAFIVQWKKHNQQELSKGHFLKQ